MLDLYVIPHSAWSEKARWGLDAQGIPYRAVPYEPLVSEPGLRLRLRRFNGRLSLPIAVHERRGVADSFEIVKLWSQRAIRPLITEENERGVLRWNRLSERMLAAGRARSAARIAQDPVASHELAPEALRGNRLVGRALGRTEARYLLRKYEGTTRHTDPLATLQEGCDTLRRRLADSEYLIGDGFTYADITMAVSLHHVTPVSDRFLSLGPSLRAALSEPTLAGAYPDLLAWRDRMYLRYREGLAPRADLRGRADLGVEALGK